MRMRPWAALAAMTILPFSVQAENQCTGIHNKEERLACYDTRAGYVDDREGKIPKDDPAVRLRIRNEAKVFAVGFPEFGSRNAELVLERNAGDTYVLSNVATLAVFDAINDAGWQPFAFGQWKRSENATKQSDIRDVGLAMVAPIGDPRQGGLGAMVTPRILKRTDIYGGKDSIMASVHADIGRRSWYSADLDAVNRNVYAFLPFVGALHEDRRGSAADDGGWSSLYTGISLNSKLNRITPRLQMTLKYQYFRALARPAGAHGRSDDFASLSFAYEFTDPENKEIKVRPAIVISREVGLDPLNSPDHVNRTHVGFGIRVDIF